MYYLRTIVLGVLIGYALPGCINRPPQFTSPDYQPDVLSRAALLSPYVYQGIINQGDRVSLVDSLSYEVATMINEQLPKHFVGSDTLRRITVSPKIRRDLSDYLYRIRLDSEHRNSKTRRVRIPDQISDELRQDNTRFVVVFVSDGYSRRLGNYNQQAAASRAVNTALTLSSMAFTPYRVGSVGAKNGKITPYLSGLDFFVLDVQKQEVLKYKRNSLEMMTVNPFTVRQHLTILFMD